MTAIDEEDNVQDAFQATVCLGWLHFELSEPGLAAAKLPKDFFALASKMSPDNVGDVSSWTLVCLVKGTYLKGAAQEKTSSSEEAFKTYHSILPWLFSIKATSTNPQFKMWTERLMVRLCLLADQSTETGQLVATQEALNIFRFWAKCWEFVGNSGSGGSDAARLRRLAWKAYYDTLSVMLRDELPYKSEVSGPETKDFAAKEKHAAHPNPTQRLQQRAELKRVETVYESLLLKETNFPKASENNLEMEGWTEAVIANWRVLCGPNWHDDELGEGGKEAVGRGVLDVSLHNPQIFMCSSPLPTIADTISRCNQDFPFYTDLAVSFHRACIPG